MLSIDEAREKILELLAASKKPALRVQSIPLDESLGRHLAEDVISSINVPPANNSAMDGYAIDSSSVNNGNAIFEVSQRIPAGTQASSLLKNTSARIFTGAEIPAGANAVVMQENCDILEDGRVQIRKLPIPMENIRPQGQDIKKGSTVLSKGAYLKPQDVGLLASIGCDKVTIYEPLRVVVFSTGDELVKPGKQLKPAQIYNSNQSMMTALLRDMGCHVITFDAVEDTLEKTQDALNKASKQADLIITSGGVSVGEEDHVKAAVENLGDIQLWKMNMKPGKPLAFGRVNDTAFLGLPGNPVSAFVTFMLIGQSLVKYLQSGIVREPLCFRMPSGFDITRKQRRPEFRRVRFVNGELESHPNQSSGVLSSVCWADGLALIPDDTLIKRGDLLTVYPLGFSG